MNDKDYFDSFLQKQFNGADIGWVLEDNPNLVTNRWIDYLYDTWKVGLIDLSTYKRLIRSDFSSHIWQKHIKPKWKERVNNVEFSVSPKLYFEYFIWLF